MSAVRPPTLWLSVAATAISVVAVAAMVSSTGPRRPLTFAGALLPGSHSSVTSRAPGGTAQAARPWAARTAAARTTARTSAAPSLRLNPPDYQPPVYQAPVAAVVPAEKLPAAQHSSGAQNSAATEKTPAASRTPAQSAIPSSPSTTRTPVSSSPLPTSGLPTVVPTTSAAEPSPTALAQALFSALNEARKLAGLPSLAWSAGLQRSAAGHDQAMAAADQLASQVGDEPALSVRQADQGVVASFSAEALGCIESTDSAMTVQQQMLAEQPPDDSRRQTLLSTAVNAVGIDILLDPAHGWLWVTEDFAQLS